VKPAFKPEAIVIGASAGAIEALGRILPVLPAGYPLPMLIVVHVPADMKNTLAELFAPKCKIEVKEAEDKEEVRPGVAYFAPPNYHLLVESDGTLSLSSDEPELFSRPSIDVLFESAADAYGAGLVGVVLTGANSDGAKGLLAIGAAGGLALAQEPQSAEVGTMPEAALKACPDARAMTVNDIATLLAQLPHNPPV